MLHIAEDLDADFVIFGTSTSDGKNLAVESRILRVNVVTGRTGASRTALLAPVRESGPLNSLMDLHVQLLWRHLSAHHHALSPNLADLCQAPPPLPLHPFSPCIRSPPGSEN